jgi:predicted TIM-barrel fold metal-dependent hydrolase
MVSIRPGSRGTMTAERSRFDAISVDAHVEEPEDLSEQLPPDLLARGPRVVQVAGEQIKKSPGLPPLNLTIADSHQRKQVPAVEQREFRKDATGGRDLPRRIQMHREEGLLGEVIFPNRFLTLSANPDVRFQIEAARIYLRFAVETFASDRRFAPSAPLPIGSVDASVALVDRIADLGLTSVVLPATAPTRPYFLADYEPLWSALSEAGLVVNFHSFGGNIAFGCDFVNLYGLETDHLCAAQSAVKDSWRPDGHSSTSFGLAHMVMTMAAGMSPLLHLTEAGVFERHPGLRFSIIESEAGWLPFALDMADHLQNRRPEVRALPLQASDYFRRQGAISFSSDASSVELVERIGSERLMWGSDYPHDEGTFPSSRATRAKLLAGVDDDVVERVLRRNASERYGVPMPSCALTDAEPTTAGARPL